MRGDHGWHSHTRHLGLVLLNHGQMRSGRARLPPECNTGVTWGFDMTDQAAAGWYQQDETTERYWTGSEWTDQTRPRGGNLPPPPPPQAGRKKKRRVFMWVFLAIQAIFLLWIITGAASGAGNPDDCGTLDAELCNSASDAGTAIGVFLIIVLWAVVDFILGVTYAIYRLARRPA